MVGSSAGAWQAVVLLIVLCPIIALPSSCAPANDVSLSSVYIFVIFGLHAACLRPAINFYRYD